MNNLRPSAGIALYVLGRIGERDSVLERLRILENTRPLPALLHTPRAFAMFSLGDTARGLDALERATDAKEMWFWGMVTSGPVLAGVRGSARLRAILARVGLSQK